MTSSSARNTQRSSSADPAREHDARKTYATEQVDYHRVLLGFVADHDESRWLSHEEISEGVLDAIDSGDDEYIVGQIEPWDRRP